MNTPLTAKKIKRKEYNHNHYLKTRFIPIPKGYIPTKKVLEILGISREYLRQIRDRFAWKIVGKRKYCYSLHSVIEYKEKKT